MNLRVDTEAVAQFDVSLQGELQTIGEATAIVFRNGNPTTVETTITNPLTGHYRVGFVVPSDWPALTKVDVRMELTYNGKTIGRTKPVGIVGDDFNDLTVERIADLLEADQQVANGFLTYYLKGTTEILLQKAISGETCVDGVSLIEFINPP